MVKPNTNWCDQQVRSVAGMYRESPTVCIFGCHRSNWPRPTLNPSPERSRLLMCGHQSTGLNNEKDLERSFSAKQQGNQESIFWRLAWRSCLALQLWAHRPWVLLVWRMPQLLVQQLFWLLLLRGPQEPVLLLERQARP